MRALFALFASQFRRNYTLRIVYVLNVSGVIMVRLKSRTHICLFLVSFRTVDIGLARRTRAVFFVLVCSHVVCPAGLSVSACMCLCRVLSVALCEPSARTLMYRAFGKNLLFKRKSVLNWLKRSL